jgi:hypothetical protein
VKKSDLKVLKLTFLNCLCQCIGSAKSINKLSLVGMQLPEKYEENFAVSSEGPSSGVT